VSKKL
jgi:hypothetical protein